MTREDLVVNKIRNNKDNDDTEHKQRSRNNLTSESKKGQPKGPNHKPKTSPKVRPPGNHRHNPTAATNPITSPPIISTSRKILVLHGNRQTGQLLVGRMDKLRKKLSKTISLVAPDAPWPHPLDANLRTWWDRKDSNGENITHYEGLEETMTFLIQLWKDDLTLEGILGFSQGARLAHLLCLALNSLENRATDHDDYYATNHHRLRYVILVAGYDAPLPSNWKWSSSAVIDPVLDIPSLHVWGVQDKIITPDQSQSVMVHYRNPQSHVHEGGHHVPMRAADVAAYCNFIQSASLQGSAPSFLQTPSDSKPITTSLESSSSSSATLLQPLTSSLPSSSLLLSSLPPQQRRQQPQNIPLIPDEETAQAQQDEVEALSAIFPDEFTMISPVTSNSADDTCMTYSHPITYQIAIPPSDIGTWPPHPLALRIQYPHNYPHEAIPLMTFVHDNNMMQFSTGHMQACRDAMQQAAEAEFGMPSVMSCVYAAREFFESGGMTSPMLSTAALADAEATHDSDDEELESDTNAVTTACSLPPASPERIQECNLQGLEIARTLLAKPVVSAEGKGGSWKYTIGLVGKPSAGKSTFFNAATGFARQRDDADNALGGATMAPHPFTTIDPNVGYCLVPAPEGSCPEDDIDGDRLPGMVGCTHGRDSKGRRLIPVMLKDVAGLVPGAYQGRGRGNKFLNDLTDADVLIHVVDASGTADTEGNTVGCSDGDNSSGAGSHPLNDLAWIRNELIEWVYTNVTYKWDNIRKRGRGKLSDMFSGYGQSQSTVWDVLFAVEKFLDGTEQRDHALDHLDEWDQGDVHRLVSAFLGVRFPMALALNKSDLPSAMSHVKDVQEALPIHGAHVGVPLCAQKEMEFVRYHLQQANSSPDVVKDGASSIPVGVWQCLHSAVMLREPVLVFPVCDMTTYAPLSGMHKVATLDASLPSSGMISCLRVAGGHAPTMWIDGHGYDTATRPSAATSILRDVVVMKPGSTVEDVFLTLKRLGAVAGEFVRAEGASRIGEKAKLVPKNEPVTRSNRILKIMTNKRR